MTAQNLSGFFIVTIRMLTMESILLVLIKKAAIFILKNSDLSDKSVI